MATALNVLNPISPVKDIGVEPRILEKQWNKVTFFILGVMDLLKRQDEIHETQGDVGQ